MAQQTALSVLGIPGKVHSFSAKTAADVITAVGLVTIDPGTARYPYLSPGIARTPTLLPGTARHPYVTVDDA